MTQPGATRAPASPRAISCRRLHSLLEIVKAVRSGADVDSVLDAIARVVAETLGFQTVVLNVYRPEWDDFSVTTVHGSDAVREALLGLGLRLEQLDAPARPRFARAGAYFIPNDAFDWSQDTRRPVRARRGTRARRARRLAPQRRAVRSARALRRQDRRDHVVRRPAGRAVGRTTSGSRSRALSPPTPPWRSRRHRRACSLAATKRASSSCCASPPSCPDDLDRRRCSAPSARRSRKRLASTRS